MKYDPSLDGLRAIAIGSVVAFHAYPGILPGGWVGVDIFFVLSGYLITRLLSGEIAENGRIGFRRFYARRFLRLTPAFACLLAFELVHAATNRAHRVEILQATAISATYLMNWNRAFHWLPQDLLPHTWSLAMEEQFYLLWPLTLTFITPRRPRTWVLGAIILVFAWRCFLAFSGADPERTYNGFDTHSDALLIGCALALTTLGPWVLKAARAAVAIPLAAMAVMLATMHDQSFFTQTIGLSLTAICAAWIMVVAIDGGWLKRLLSLPPMTYTGRISYGWYLWHYPAIAIIRAHFHNPAAGVVAAAVSYLVAVASFHFVERPFLRLKARFEPARQVVAPDAPPSLGAPTLPAAKA